MANSQARIETRHSEKYLGRLCQHFGHRIPVSHRAGAGRIEFPSGICSLTAEPGVLILHAQAQDDLARRLVEGMVASHLERFAVGETLVISWTAEASGA